jgi:hypothetical protein
MPKFKEWLFGSGDKKISNYNAGQNQNFNQLTDSTQQAGQGSQDVLKYLMQFMDPNSDIYKNFEAPYRQEFEQQTVPGLAEEYAGKGALSSSGFGQALGSAGAGLQTKLAALKSTMQRQAGQDIFSQYNQQANQSLNAKPFDLREGSTGVLNNALTAYAGGVGGGGGFGGLMQQLMQMIQGGGGISGSKGNYGGNIAQSNYAGAPSRNNFAGAR